MRSEVGSTRGTPLDQNLTASRLTAAAAIWDRKTGSGDSESAPRLLDDGRSELTAYAATRQPRRGTSRPVVLALAAVPAVAIIAWTIAIFAAPRLQFAVVAPEWAVRVNGASMAARLFAALVLLLFPAEPSSSRLRWVGSGLLILGTGALASNYVGPLLLGRPDLNTDMYQSLTVWLIADSLFVLGLVPVRAPELTRRRLALAFGAFTVVAVWTTLDADDLPLLLRGVASDSPAALADVALHGLTAWHWALSVVMLVLTGAAAVGAVRHALRGTLPVWLVPSMIIWVGAELHNSFSVWASDPFVTTGDLLRLAFAVTILLGGVIELQHIATERTLLLAAHRDQAARLTELAIMKADFTSMVAHELVTPLAAIRTLAGILRDESVSRDVRLRAVDGIQEQVAALQNLAGDVRAIAQIERTDFAVEPRPVSIAALLGEAEDFAGTLPGDHPVAIHAPGDTQVLADPERIGQVLRNLLDNAAKYSPSGTPIAVNAAREGDQVRIQVIDHGRGIFEEDLPRIFEKFGRGRASIEQGTPGVGVGLYLSRRILRAHGTDIAVETTPGAGSVFSFRVPVAP